MKKFFQIIGVFTLFVVSFSYHSEVKEVVKNSDSLVNEIEKNSKLYKKEKIEAIITDKTIIPGINGLEVDVNKSYKAMKQGGVFNPGKIVYKKIKIDNELEKNKDKYIISGSKTRKEVALVFKVSFFDDVDTLVNRLQKNNFKGTFFIDYLYAKENVETIKKLLIGNHTVGNLGVDSDYIWIKTLISSSQKNNYCITENEKRLNYCFTNNDYTIKSKLIKNNPFLNMKNNLTEGVILYFDINTSLNNEIQNILNYIKSRGYQIVSLETLLRE